MIKAGLFTIAGMLVLAYGCWLIHPGTGFIVSGILLIGWGHCILKVVEKQRAQDPSDPS